MRGSGPRHPSRPARAPATTLPFWRGRWSRALSAVSPPLAPDRSVFNPLRPVGGFEPPSRAHPGLAGLSWLEAETSGLPRSPETRALGWRGCAVPSAGSARQRGWRPMSAPASVSLWLSGFRGWEPRGHAPSRLLPRPPFLAPPCWRHGAAATNRRREPHPAARPLRFKSASLRLHTPSVGRPGRGSGQDASYGVPERPHLVALRRRPPTRDGVHDFPRGVWRKAVPEALPHSEQ